MILKDARTRWATRQKRFVVGYINAGNTLYGGGKPSTVSCTDPLTRKQAAAKLSTMPCRGCAVFELVPVQVNG